MKINQRGRGALTWAGRSHRPGDFDVFRADTIDALQPGDVVDISSPLTDGFTWAIVRWIDGSTITLRGGYTHTFQDSINVRFPYMHAAHYGTRVVRGTFTPWGPDDCGADCGSCDTCEAGR